MNTSIKKQFELDLNQVRQQIERGLDILSGKVTEEKDWIEKALVEKGEISEVISREDKQRG